MRENCSVGCEQEGCSSLNSERPKALSFHLAQKSFLSSELERRVRDGDIQKDMTTDTVAARVPSKKRKAGGYLEKYPYKKNVQNGIYPPRKARKCSTKSLRSFPVLPLKQLKHAIYTLFHQRLFSIKLTARLCQLQSLLSTNG